MKTIIIYIYIIIIIIFVIWMICTFNSNNCNSVNSVSDVRTQIIELQSEITTKNNEIFKLKSKLN